MLLFTYGTLQRGNVRNYILDGAQFLGSAQTHESFLLKDRGDFPLMVQLSKRARAVLKDELSPVRGELFNINQELMDVLDHVEGHPNFFTRRRVLINKDEGGLPIMVNAYVIAPDKQSAPWYDDNVRNMPTCKNGSWNKSFKGQE